MDTIHIKGLRLFAYHGVGAEEKRDGQTFVLDITLKADLSRARRSDDLEDTVNYAAVCQTVREAFTAQSFDLIERAAQQAVDAVLDGYPQVEEITLVLKKPEAPIPEEFDYVAVEVTQRRKER
ncbi:dihydroneopterin aldolase [Clostridium sp. CAG:1013]|jgi:dihydroneopterin aldolase|nr:dihydroneopterin aldolase [Clostridium sp. CAG:1013]